MFLSSFSQEKDSVVIDFENKINNAPNDSLKVQHLLDLGTYQKSRNTDKLPTYHQQIREILKKDSYNNIKHHKTLLIQSGVYKRRSLDYSGALKDYLAAQKIIIETNDSIYLGVNYGNIAMLYKFKNECDKAIINFKKAIKTNTNNKNHRLLGLNYSNIAKCYAEINQIDSAFYAFDKGIYHSKLSGAHDVLQGVYGNKSSLLLDQKRYKEALPLQLNFLKYTKSVNKHLSATITSKKIAETYFQLNDNDKALLYANEAIKLGTKINMMNRIYDVYKIRGEVYKSAGKFDLAFNDLTTYNKIQKEINGINNAKKFKEIEMTHSFEKVRITDSIVNAEERRRIELQLEKEEIQKQLYLASLIIISIVGLLTLYLGYLLYLKIKKKNKIKQDQLFNEINDLNTEVTSKKQEVNELLTETIIHLRSKEKLAENLSKLSHEEEGVTLKSIIADLKADKIEDSKIVVLKQNIETLNYDFLKNLKNLHPNLTKTDIEVCSFIKIGLSRKEISNLRKTSLDAIKSTRFRLKKKLNLTAKDSLDEYIKSL
ncbi:tetratricopeptide repeat protein [uncultured Tenacibaculum sp.]|uniref:tetratricopeptide repeat protein n=1 Tax=uncultured Tenacibaculum sp. TaxID=174713 RepID=UPI0026249149|nr:tetratricopeptide repeat protein [uncultured Tenacibaculum sp.]